MKVIYSQDKNRTNQLSLQPGGSIITVHYVDGTIIHYDKIKNVKKYVNVIKNIENINRVICNTETIYQK